MNSPIQDAFDAKAQEQAGCNGAEWLWAQAGLLNETSLKMGDITEVLAFIAGRIGARALSIESEMNRAASPFLWPFSTQTQNTLYPGYSAEELTRVREQQMNGCTEALRAFVLGDIWAQASDARAVTKLGDGKPGSIGEAGTLLKQATGALDPVMKAYGSRDTSGTPSGGGNMSITTHATNPTYPDVASVEGLPWYPWSCS